MSNHQNNRIPTVSTGTIERHEYFESNFVSARHVDVWLPNNYSISKKHAVLYMHDGQMLFDPTTTWNKQAWGVAEIVESLMEQGDIRDCIVVGIWNSDSGRHADYFPKKPFDSLPEAFRNNLIDRAMQGDDAALFAKSIQSDSYLRFMVEELKPFIDRTYSTFSNAENTFVAGSSMGGLISMYAICEHPDIFGGAGCLSTHWIGMMAGEDNPIPDAFVNYLKANLPTLLNHRIYFDYGTETLDAFYEPHQIKVDQVMASNGFVSTNWQTHKFEGANHSEDAWRERLHIPLTFLMRS
ncbi:MAG: alpha/beta hydrolase-fold protein [Chloroflexota bacterium]